MILPSREPGGRPNGTAASPASQAASARLQSAPAQALNLHPGQALAARHSKPVLRKRWLTALALLLGLLGTLALGLIAARISANDNALRSLAADHLLSDAVKAVQRLRVAATQPNAPAAMQQDVRLLAAMAREDYPSALPGYALGGAQVVALRALLRPVAEDLRGLGAHPDAASRAQSLLTATQSRVEALRGEAAQAIARDGQRLAATAFIPVTIQLLVATTLVALFVFLVMVLRRSAASHAAQLELSSWADDTARLLAAIPGVLVRSSRDSKGVWVRSFVGNAVTQLTGHSVAEALAFGWLRNHTPPEDLPLIFRAFEEALAGRPYAETIRFRHKNGHLLRLRILLSRHEGPDGQAEILSLWSDVTREHDLAEHLAHTARLAHIGDLMSNLAHELNQPLTSLTLAANSAARQVDRPEPDLPRLRTKLEVVVAMAARASALVERLREFTRNEHEPLAALRLAEVVAAAEEVMGNRLRLLGIAVKRDLPAGLPEVMGQALPLEQVLTQLISNVCDAYEAQGTPAEHRLLEITARSLGDQVELAVQDQAGGIPPEHLPRIFEPFFTTKAVGKGTGLGLSSSFGILREMGGSIAGANHGLGARFSLLIPAAR
jgi:C4-dicarboxylate-specific signal transduction histidine kinase